jgi:hypothetical protein
MGGMKRSGAVFGMTGCAMIGALVIAPLLLSFAWRGIIGTCDYASQGGLLLLMLTLPFCTSLESGFGKQFALICLSGFAWGLWRVFYFDQVTKNDIPGVGYLIVPVMMGAISAAIFGVRRRLKSAARSKGGPRRA